MWQTDDLDGEAQALDMLLDEVVATYAVDPERIYLAGKEEGQSRGWDENPGRPVRTSPDARVARRRTENGLGSWTGLVISADDQTEAIR